MSDDTKPKARKSLTREERRHLLNYHMKLLRGGQALVDETHAPYKAAQEAFTALVNDAKSDLGKGYTRKYLVGLMEDTTARLRDLSSEEVRRAEDRQDLGLPVFGVQGDLFGEAAAAMPEEARDEVQYEFEGFMRGKAGLLQEIPDGTPPRFHQAVMRGFAAGQKTAQEEFLAGQALKQRMATPDAGAEAKDLNGDDEKPQEDEDKTPPDPEVVAKKARDLKKSGWADKAKAGAQPEPAHA